MPAAPLREDLGATLRTELPVTQHLGISVVALDQEAVTLGAPLAANVNHKGTAFAGSLNAIATLAGWSWVWAALRRHGLAGHVVIQDSSVTYRRPVAGDFTAWCGPPDPERLARFLDAMRRRGRARIALQVEVADSAGPAVSFTGRYVAHRES